MQTQTEKNADLSQKEISLKMIIDAWKVQNERVDKFLKDVSDEQLKTEVAPGKNSGFYLLGHLTAVNDGLLTILGLGEKLYPQLEDTFLKNAENKETATTSIDELKQYWNEINAKVSEQFANLSADAWFEKHTLVSDEDFAKEPYRNKLNVLISRTNHQSYHLGQLNLLIGK